MDYYKTTQDFQADLSRMLKHVVKCCHEFDSGDRESMMQVTGDLRALFKPSGKAHQGSLLQQLSLTGITFSDVAGVDAMPSQSAMSRVSFMLSPFPDFLPQFDPEGRPEKSFDDWWNGVVLHYKDRYNLSRKNLVEHVSETYVLHSDGKVDRDFYLLYTNTDSHIGWKAVSMGIKVKPPSVICSVLRMICHEVLLSFQSAPDPVLKMPDLDFDGVYFNRLKPIRPYMPFGDNQVQLIDKESGVSLEFYSLKNGKLRKLPNVGDYELMTMKDAVPDLTAFIEETVDEIISDTVHKYFRERQYKTEPGVVDFKPNVLIDAPEKGFAIVHRQSNRGEYANKLRCEFSFRIRVIHGLPKSHPKIFFRDIIVEVEPKNPE